MRIPLKGRLGALFFASLLVFAAAYVVIYVVRSRTRIEHLYEAKMLNLRVEDVILPRERPIPVDVMIGSSARITCDRIRVPVEQGKTSFHFDLGGEAVDADDCQLDHVFQGQPGTAVPIQIEYRLTDPAGKARVLDHWATEVRLVPAGTFVRLRSLATPDGEPIGTITVPHNVIPYMDAAMKLDGDAKDYVALFFLRRPGHDELLLRVSVQKDASGGLAPVSAPLVRYRRFGADLAGYAAWPKEPIAVGNAEDVREMFEIITGVFRASDVPKLLGMCCGGARPEGGVLVINALPTDDVKRLAIGELMSEPIRVVRAARGVDRAAFLPEPGSAPPGAPTSGSAAPGSNAAPASAAPASAPVPASAAAPTSAAAH